MSADPGNSDQPSMVTYHVALDSNERRWVVERWEGSAIEETWFDSHTAAEEFALSRTDGTYV